MDNLIFILFACLAFPLVLATFLMERSSRIVVLFIIFGSFIALFASEVNTVLWDFSGKDVRYATTNITPISEELLKAVPVLLYAFIFDDDRGKMVTYGAAMGIGFAILENIYIFVQNGSHFTLSWALQRAIGASLMHAICTGSVGYGISFVRKRKKLFYTGTFALLITSSVYHSVFNTLIQSDQAVWGFALSVVTYIPIVYFLRKKKPQRSA